MCYYFQLSKKLSHQKLIYIRIRKQIFNQNSYITLPLRRDKGHIRLIAATLQTSHFFKI